MNFLINIIALDRLPHMVADIARLALEINLLAIAMLDSVPPRPYILAAIAPVKYAGAVKLVILKVALVRVAVGVGQHAEATLFVH